MSIDGELWHPIEDFPEYEVSSFGRIRRNGRVKATHVFNGRANRRPWSRVTLHENGTTHYRAVHVLVANAFLGERPQGMTVHFRNGDTTDCRVDNLYYDIAETLDLRAKAAAKRGRIK
ncbi:HNH endonuclease [Amycolatopsis sp. Poz14]|uniref:HNH endonuclease n=1 Tax=Amycolatopsis sp. Poz14 TaxID=1447705 RepID=UPI001F95BA41|nr:HNH endonuclease [Amycolatopsis sp. Poz14]